MSKLKLRPLPAQKHAFSISKENLHMGIFIWKDGEYQFKPTTWTRESYGWLFSQEDLEEILHLAKTLPIPGGIHL